MRQKTQKQYERNNIKIYSNVLENTRIDLSKITDVLKIYVLASPYT
jgi:hypothetical protein